MPLKRLLVAALLVALALRLAPIVGPWVWPALKPRVERLRRRADLATAAVMIALVISTLVRGEPAWALVVAVLSVPALIAGARAIRDWWRSLQP